MLKKLDNESRKNFELSLKAKDVPTFDEFIAFLEQRETILLSVDKNCIVETKTILRKPNLSFKTKTNLLMNQSVENKSCIVCKDKTLHPIFRCKKFLELNPEKRLDLVRLHKLCELCLRKNHKRMQCTSTYVCPCGKKHSRSICTAAIDDRRKWVIPSAELPVLTNPEDRESNVVDSSTQNTVLSSTASQHRKNVLISTGSVFLRNNEGRELKCPVIFDSASNINIISRKMCDFLDSNPRIGEKLTLQVYRFNRVIFGVNSSPFLLATTIKYHIEKYNEIHPITVQHLDSFMYVDDWITGQDTREEALFMSRHAKNIMKEAGMEMRKWISNDTVLMAQWAAEGFDTHPMDASIRLGTNKTKVLGMAWQTLDDYLTLDTKDNLRIPRLVLDSTNDEVSDLIEIHIFCDASKLAYGAAAYVKPWGFSSSSIEFKGSRNRPQEKECKVFHWTDSKIVLFWIKGSSKRWKQFVANRVQEISKLTDPDSWFHCSGQDNPSDFLSRGHVVGNKCINTKWWTGPAFLRTDELPKTVSECPELNEVDYLPELKSKDSKEHTVLTLNFNQTFFDHLLSRSNRFLTIVRVLSFLYRFLFNIRNPTNKKTGPLISDEMEEAEIYLMKQVQLSSFYKEIRAMQNGDDICNKSKILNLYPFLDKGIIRVGGRLKDSRLPY
ncbi:integrase catalytic domain-containing protein [Trichonephila clavipes]|nr:integrase catalytic domain-containing protein [Trichonephila clavipes]